MNRFARGVKSAGGYFERDYSSERYVKRAAPLKESPRLECPFNP